jgi:hypothetical protein
MLKNLAEAKEFAVEKIEEIVEDKLSDREKDLIEFKIEDDFYHKLEEIVSDEEIENAGLASQEELDAYLFTHVPNYNSILEDVTANFLAEYMNAEFSAEEKE